MTELTITAKGQITLKRSILDRLGVRPGQMVNAEVMADGSLHITAAKSVVVDPRQLPGAKDHPARGMFFKSGRTPATLADMQEAIEAGACGE